MYVTVLAAAGTTAGSGELRRLLMHVLVRCGRMGKRDGRAVRIGYLMREPSFWRRGLSPENRSLVGLAICVTKTISQVCRLIRRSLQRRSVDRSNGSWLSMALMTAIIQ